MRSKLFVPGSRPELFDKALASAADALSFDLEDAVAEPRKAEARAALQDLLTSGHATPSGKTLIVRVNGPETPHFQADVAAVVRPGLHMINVPKVEHVDQVREAAQAVARAEATNGFGSGGTPGAAAPVKLLLNIESPRGLRLAYELAAADPRVAGLQLGLADLFEPAGIHRREIAAISQAMFGLRIAAAEAGVFAYDSAFADVRDAEGFRAEAALARRLGFLGKSCIHPSQIALANDVFRPSDAEIAAAQRVVAAADEADASGVGAYLVDGKMVDRPFVDRARVVLAQARSLGLIAG
ncbi:citrate lyase subunit beta / citryl-CoA lyase [Cupriavidus sp. YR651]|uniref:HpcH/HpaI aldolase/citrate lyase family protein n=1 Tax=Cupriavidus sp. YR651 TaxID=1855315 RepID=UPI000887FD59|nr:CoA ester lyase [Cupriavidus sp. YR651]SDD02981.1 citrate lyase subunit beta / citryl-CoA lyase [Cupriavidus sp. YR651]